MTCRECGCTDLAACATVRGETEYVCWWAEDDLCSFCALSMATVTRKPVRGVDVVSAVGGVL